jgi:nucleotide-binding universal stress UspA family protein
MKTTHEEVTTAAARPAAPDLRWARLLVPVDFTPASIAAIQYAGAIARRDESSICLMHVAESISGCEDENLFLAYGEMAHQAEQRLATFARRWLPPETPVRVLVQRGNPAQEIVRAARDLQCDVIILGTHRPPWWLGWRRNGVAQRVMGKAPCHVFTLQSPEARELNPVYWETPEAAVE